MRVRSRRFPLTASTVCVGLVAFLLQPPHCSVAQITRFGLDSLNITALVSESEDLGGGSTMFGNLLFAGIDALLIDKAMDGVFVARANDVRAHWEETGLRQRTKRGITALGLQHWGVGPRDGLHLFAAVHAGQEDSSEVVLYRCTFGSDPMPPLDWQESDQGISRRHPFYGSERIQAIIAWHYTGHTPPQPVLAGGFSTYVSEAGGSLWNRIDSSIEILSMDVMPKWFGNVAWAGGAEVVRLDSVTGMMHPRVMVSRDQGLSWKVQRLPLNGNSYVWGIAIAPGSSDTVFIGLDGVRRTFDGGMQWELCMNDPSFTVNALLCDPRNPTHVYAGGRGVENGNTVVCKRSTDLGATWSNIYAPQGVSVEYVQCMTIAFRDSADRGPNAKRGLFFGTHGSGVWVYDIDGPASALDIPDQRRRLPASIHPNPARDHAELSIHIPEAASVELRITDVLGRTVQATSFPIRDAGAFNTILPLRGLSPGVYFCRLASKEHVVVLRMIVG